jgi:hypothetical protein
MEVLYPYGRPVRKHYGPQLAAPSARPFHPVTRPYLGFGKMASTPGG